MNKNKLKTNNILSYRVDLKMEGFKYWNWKVKKDDCNSNFNWDTQNTLGNSGISVASKPRENSYLKGWHPRKRLISSFLLFVEFSQRTICIVPKRLETRD